MKKILTLALLFSGLLLSAQNFDPMEHSTFKTEREDGRYTSSRAVAHMLMKRHEPNLAYSDSISDFDAWKSRVRDTMARLVKHPVLADLPEPVRISVRQREGYRVEKWEAYPLPDCAVPYLVLVPDAAGEGKSVPAVLCIPGWGGTKEEMAGEPGPGQDPYMTVTPTKNAQALAYVKEGLVAVAIDNPASGEASDLELIAGRGSYDFQTFSRALLELEWNYLGYSSYIAKHILDWIKLQPCVRADRIVVSGFSFGTEPLMVLGSLDDSIYAFVYNDFLCRTRERALVKTMPDEKGRRPWPNDIEHLIPGFLVNFDFPDLVAALAPRPVICTEGGLDRDFRMVASAFAKTGRPENFTCYHYRELQDPEKRQDLETVPEGVDSDTFFRLVNVQPPNHYFKSEYIIPWIRGIMAE